MGNAALALASAAFVGVGPGPAASSAEAEEAEESEESEEDGKDDEDGEESQLVQEVVGTELVYPQERGEWQLTLGSAYQRADAQQVSTTSVAVELGLTDAWQIGAAWDAAVVVPEPDGIRIGTGEVELSTQYSAMYVGGGPFSGAIGLQVQLPTAPGAEDDAGVQYEPYAVAAVDIRRRAHLFGTGSLLMSGSGLSPIATAGIIARAGPLRPSPRWAGATRAWS